MPLSNIKFVLPLSAYFSEQHLPSNTGRLLRSYTNPNTT